VDVRGIHHIGVAVADLDQAVDTWERLFGASLEHRQTLPDQGVEVASLRLGTGRLELLAALGPETPVGRFLLRRGPGMHHLALEVDDVEGELGRLAAEGTPIVDEHARAGALGLPVAFLHPSAAAGVLTELVGRG
jgi:methylmalonyl-CoA/ethylmalonyl-CoA epimerase